MPKELRKDLRAVLFDWDNTLVDSWRASMRTLNATLAHFDLPTVTEEEMLGLPQTSTRESFPAVFGDRAAEAEEFYYQKQHEVDRLNGLESLPGAAELLQACAQQDLYMAIVSNKRGDNLRREVAHMGWSSYFAAIVGANDTHADKPSAAPVLSALEAGQIECGNHVWLVGDSEVDVQCAINAGIVPIYIPSARSQHENVERFAGVYKVSHCKYLTDLISNSPLI